MKNGKSLMRVMDDTCLPTPHTVFLTLDFNNCGRLRLCVDSVDIDCTSFVTASAPFSAMHKQHF